MRMWWYYDGIVELDDGTEIQVNPKHTLEEALETFADWKSGSPIYKEFITENEDEPAHSKTKPKKPFQR